MKTTYKYIALAAMAFSAVACSQENLTSSYLSDSKAVHISAQVGTSDNAKGGFQSRSNPLGTTAEEQAKFNTGDQISVAAGSQDAVTYTLGENDTWMPATGKYLVWETDNMPFTAYYPVGKNGATTTTFTLPSSYSSVKDLAEADYMTYSGVQSNALGNGITLPMERKMVRLVISTTFGNQYESGSEVSSIKIHTNSIGYADGMVKNGNVKVTAYKQDGKFYALLTPTLADASATFLTVTVNGNEELTVKGIPATKAGNSYEMNLTVGKDKASVETVKVSDWKSGSIIGGEAPEIYEINGHEFVDLGLPSGTMWATCNIGATKPEECGDYFAWGETATKDSYSKDSYKFIKNSICTKYNTTDSKQNLDLEDDVAYNLWGDGICMPTLKNYQELINNCTRKWVTINNVSGNKFIAKNGASIFFPVTGHYLDKKLYDKSSIGYYWVSYKLTVSSGDTEACYIESSSSDFIQDYRVKWFGMNVRAVVKT